MRVLFLTPSEISAGEAVTCFHIARAILAAGGEVRFLCSRFTAGFVKKHYAEAVNLLDDEGEENRARFAKCVAEFSPDIIVFAEWAILHFSSGTVPLANEAWREALFRGRAELVTLDHLGYAQGAKNLRFGPPRANLIENIEPAPSEMQVLLPCPVQGPEKSTGCRGVSFRYWRSPEISFEERARVRARYLDSADQLLILHAVPTWAYLFAERVALPFYLFLPTILTVYLSQLGRPVKIVSLNSGELLRSPNENSSVTFANIGGLPPDEYERLLLSADLFCTENTLSVSLGKAVLGSVPSVLLANGLSPAEIARQPDCLMKEIALKSEEISPGSIYPHEAFPIFGQEEIHQLRLLENNPFREAFTRLEIYDEEKTRDALCALLTDASAKSAQRKEQAEYKEALDALPDAVTALSQG